MNEDKTNQEDLCIVNYEVLSHKEYVLAFTISKYAKASIQTIEMLKEDGYELIEPAHAKIVDGTAIIYAKLRKRNDKLVIETFKEMRRKK